MEAKEFESQSPHILDYEAGTSIPGSRPSHQACAPQDERRTSRAAPGRGRDGGVLNSLPMTWPSKALGSCRFSQPVLSATWAL